MTAPVAQLTALDYAAIYRAAKIVVCVAVAGTVGIVAWMVCGQD